jgi:hypothetical protein
MSPLLCSPPRKTAWLAPSAAATVRMACEATCVYTGSVHLPPRRTGVDEYRLAGTAPDFATRKATFARLGNHASQGGNGFDPSHWLIDPLSRGQPGAERADSSAHGALPAVGYAATSDGSPATTIHASCIVGIALACEG